MSETDARTPALSDKGAAVSLYDRGRTPFWTLRNNIDDLFDYFFRGDWSRWSPARRRGDGAAVRSPAAIPTLDVIDKEKEVKLIADLPGLTEEDIDVQVSDSTLTISGEKRKSSRKMTRRASDMSRSAVLEDSCGVSRCPKALTRTGSTPLSKMVC